MNKRRINRAELENLQPGVDEQQREKKLKQEQSQAEMREKQKEVLRLMMWKDQEAVSMTNSSPVTAPTLAAMVPLHIDIPQVNSPPEHVGAAAPQASTLFAIARARREAQRELEFRNASSRTIVQPQRDASSHDDDEIAIIGECRTRHNFSDEFMRLMRRGHAAATMPTPLVASLLSLEVIFDPQLLKQEVRSAPVVLVPTPQLGKPSGVPRAPYFQPSDIVPIFPDLQGSAFSFVVPRSFTSQTTHSPDVLTIRNETDLMLVLELLIATPSSNGASKQEAFLWWWMLNSNRTRQNRTSVARAPAPDQHDYSSFAMAPPPLAPPNRNRARGAQRSGMRVLTYREPPGQNAPRRRRRATTTTARRQAGEPPRLRRAQ
ncbi:unnamed protein product [Caenorhabditis sp. 36 PRJEB53466]|nr:unnamed protein product [Caenorhabditis sp. 36 PRJEB53466]